MVLYQLTATPIGCDTLYQYCNNTQSLSCYTQATQLLDTCRCLFLPDSPLCGTKTDVCADNWTSLLLDYIESTFEYTGLTIYSSYCSGCDINNETCFTYSSIDTKCQLNQSYVQKVTFIYQ